MKIAIIFVGMPCSGKSTIAKIIKNRLDIAYISSGDIARKIATDGDALINLNKGEMADEELMRHMIYDTIEVMEDDVIILDGFPRFIDQYKWFRYSFENVKIVLISIEVLYDTAYARNRNRNRGDDGIESFTSRILYFIRNTMPMVIMIQNYNKDHCYSFRNDLDSEGVVANICNVIREEIEC